MDTETHQKTSGAKAASARLTSSKSSCAFEGATGENITCAACLSDSPFHETSKASRVDWKALAISRYECMEAHRIDAERLAGQLSLIVRTVNDTLRHGLTVGQTEALSDCVKSSCAVIKQHMGGAR